MNSLYKKVNRNNVAIRVLFILLRISYLFRPLLPTCLQWPQWQYFMKQLIPDWNRIDSEGEASARQTSAFTQLIQFFIERSFTLDILL